MGPLRSSGRACLSFCLCLGMGVTVLVYFFFFFLCIRSCFLADLGRRRRWEYPNKTAQAGSGAGKGYTCGGKNRLLSLACEGQRHAAAAIALRAACSGIPNTRFKTKQKKLGLVERILWISAISPSGVMVNSLNRLEVMYHPGWISILAQR